VKIVILNTQGKVFEGDIDSAIVPTSLGLIGVLTDHADLLTKIVPGNITLRTNDGEKEITVGNGVLEINENLLTVLTR
jgi:F-type H+-transporting ATPase subunit epsilon